jgi:hypothetical protein
MKLFTIFKNPKSYMKNEETPSVDGVVWAYVCNMSIVFIKIDKQTYFYYSLSISFAGENSVD